MPQLHSWFFFQLRKTCTFRSREVVIVATVITTQVAHAQVRVRGGRQRKEADSTEVRRGKSWYKNLQIIYRTSPKHKENVTTIPKWRKRQRETTDNNSLLSFVGVSTHTRPGSPLRVALPSNTDRGCWEAADTYTWPSRLSHDPYTPCRLPCHDVSTVATNHNHASLFHHFNPHRKLPPDSASLLLCQNTTTKSPNGIPLIYCSSVDHRHASRSSASREKDTQDQWRQLVEPNSSP